MPLDLRPRGACGVDEKNATGYGAVALYVGGTGEVRIQGLRLEGSDAVVTSPEKVSSRFTIRAFNTAYYGWGATTADINHDGTLDIVSGPFYYLGPNFTERAGIATARFTTRESFAPDMVNSPPTSPATAGPTSFVASATVTWICT